MKGPEDGEHGAGSTAASDGPLLSIGALSKATGIPVETLRTWERRYGYPKPERKPSGHRVYAVGTIARLRRIAEALARGHRAGDVVAASDAELDVLLRAHAAPAALPREPLGQDALPRLLATVESFDGERLTRLLLADYARLGPLEFLRVRVAPLIREVGCAWADGRFEIRHEHFISERIGDLLRSLRLPYEERSRGTRVVLATLPGEQHTLGLQMAALTLAAAGYQVLYLGSEVPLSEIAAVGRERDAIAVGISVSTANAGDGSTMRLRRLRDQLPRRIALIVGGDGAPEEPAEMKKLSDLPALDAWARALASPP